MRRQLVILCLFILFIDNPLFSKEKGGLKFKGKMYSDLGILQRYRADENDDVTFYGKSIFSLNFKNNNRKYGKVEGSFDLIFPYGLSIMEYYPSYSDSGTSKIIELFSFGKVPVFFDIRKLYFSLYLPFADISVGRQIINFGKGVVFSPVDAFSIVELQDINLRKNGADIFNMQIPLNDITGIDFIVELPFMEERFSSSAKVFTTVGSFDLSVLGIYKYSGKSGNMEDEVLGGLTFKGDLGLGFYGESVLHILTDSKKVFFEGMLGADYSINGKWIMILEYLYKQKDWDRSLLGVHNAFGSVQFVINDLSNISGSFIYDFENNMALGTIQLYYNILQNVNTIFYAQGIDSNDGTYMKYSLRAEVKF